MNTGARPVDDQAGVLFAFGLSKPSLVTNIAAFAGAALAEIAGCFAFWAWMRLGVSPLWLLPGLASLIAFASLLTVVDATVVGRAYAAYGEIYVVASLIWLRLVEGVEPNQWDMLGAATCLVRNGVILYGPRPG